MIQCKEDGINANTRLSSQLDKLKAKCKLCGEEMEFSTFKNHPTSLEEHIIVCKGCGIFKDKSGFVSLHQKECAPFLSLQNQALKKEIISLKQSLEISQNESLSLKKSLEISQKQIENKTRQIESQHDKIQTQQKKIETQNDKIEKLEKEIESTRKEIEEFRKSEEREEERSRQ